MLKLFSVQVAKLSLSHCVVDDEQMGRCFSSNNLTDHYPFNADG